MDSQITQDFTFGNTEQPTNIEFLQIPLFDQAIHSFRANAQQFAGFLYLAEFAEMERH